VTERTPVDFDLLAAWADRLVPVAEAAGHAILEVQRGDIAVSAKADASPVTIADGAAEAIILEALEDLAPRFPIVAEEQVANGKMPELTGNDFWLIDPLDGTKEFIAGRAEFTVNVALVTAGTPLLGIVGAPAMGLIWRGIVGRGAERIRLEGARPGAAEPIHTRPMPKYGEPWIAAVSRSHGDRLSEAFIDRRPNAVREQLGSAVKFGRLAEGSVDLYPRLAPTSEWDVAAGHAVVTAAGGRITAPDGGVLRYGEGRDGGFIVPGFIAWGDPAAAEAAH